MHGINGAVYDTGDSELPMMASSNSSVSDGYHDSLENGSFAPIGHAYAALEATLPLELGQTKDGVKLYRPLKSTSVVWNYFGFPLKVCPEYAGELDKRRVHCVLCENMNIAYSGSTSSLQKHLKSKHDISTSALQQLQANPVSDGVDLLDDAANPPHSLSHLAEFNGAPQQDAFGADSEREFKPNDILSFLSQQQLKAEAQLSLATSGSNRKASQNGRSDHMQASTFDRVDKSVSEKAIKRTSPASKTQQLSGQIAQSRQMPTLNGFFTGIKPRNSPALQSGTSVYSPNSSATEMNGLPPENLAIGVPRPAPAYHLTAPVHVDVGGTLYTTTLQTLTKYPNSRLSQLFNGSLAIVLDELKQHYFIDRDGPVFRHILNFLRTGRLILSDDFQEIDLLASEARFYQLHDLSRDIETFRLCRNLSKDSLLSFSTSAAQPRSVINHHPINSSSSNDGVNRSAGNGHVASSLAFAKSTAASQAAVRKFSNLGGHSSARSSPLAAVEAAPPNANPCSTQLPSSAKRRKLSPPSLSLASRNTASNLSASANSGALIADQIDRLRAYAKSNFTAKTTNELKTSTTTCHRGLSAPIQHRYNGRIADAESEVIGVKIFTQEEEDGGAQQESAVLISGCQATVEEIFPEAQNALFNMEIVADAVVGLNLKDCSPQFDANVVFDRLHAHGFNADEAFEAKSDVIRDRVTGLAFNSMEYLFTKG